MDKNAERKVKRDHERLLRDVPTQDLVEHLGRRMDHMVIGYMPKIDAENMYTRLVGKPAECEELARELVYDAIDASLPTKHPPG